MMGIFVYGSELLLIYESVIIASVVVVSWGHRSKEIFSNNLSKQKKENIQEKSDKIISWKEKEIIEKKNMKFRKIEKTEI